VSQLAFTFEHRPALSGDDFLVAPSNKAAVAWLDAWPDWPAPLLVIHGPPGAGKSHLGQVFQARTAGHPNERLIDDAPPIRDEEELLHLYNTLAADGGHLLMTAQSAPAQWGIRLADLRSRVLAAPSVVLGAPEDELIRAVLAKLFSDRQLRVEADVIEFLGRRMERSLSEAQRLVAELDRAALAEHRAITLPLARSVLTDR
jgi:chromosomal replication initiation ATPase DnaA